MTEPTPKRPVASPSHVWQETALRLSERFKGKIAVDLVFRLLHEMRRAERDAGLRATARMRGLLAERGIDVPCDVVCQAVLETTGQRTTVANLWRDNAHASRRADARAKAEKNLAALNENDFRERRERHHK